MIVRISSIDRITQQCDQPRLRNYSCHPFGGNRVRQISWGGLSGDESLFILQPRRELRTIPPDTLVEVVVEVVQFLSYSPLNIRVLGQELIKKRCSAPFCSDDDEVRKCASFRFNFQLWSRPTFGNVL